MAQTTPVHVCVVQATLGTCVRGTGYPRARVCVAWAIPVHVCMVQVIPAHVCVAQVIPGHVCVVQVIPVHVCVAQVIPAHVCVARAIPGHVCVVRGLSQGMCVCYPSASVWPGLPQCYGIAIMTDSYYNGLGSETEGGEHFGDSLQ